MVPPGIPEFRAARASSRPARARSSAAPGRAEPRSWESTSRRMVARPGRSGARRRDPRPLGLALLAVLLGRRARRARALLPCARRGRERAAARALMEPRRLPEQRGAARPVTVLRSCAGLAATVGRPGSGHRTTTPAAHIRDLPFVVRAARIVIAGSCSPRCSSLASGASAVGARDGGAPPRRRDLPARGREDVRATDARAHEPHAGAEGRHALRLPRDDDGRLLDEEHARPARRSFSSTRPGRRVRKLSMVPAGRTRARSTTRAGPIASRSSSLPPTQRRGATIGPGRRSGGSFAPRPERMRLALGVLVASLLVVPAAAGKQAAIVVVDPGHDLRANSETEPIGPGSSPRKIKDGGGTSGVVSGLREAELNLRVGLRLRALLERAGVTVVMTRTTNGRHEHGEHRPRANREPRRRGALPPHPRGRVDGSLRSRHAHAPSRAPPRLDRRRLRRQQARGANRAARAPRGARLPRPRPAGALRLHRASTGPTCR